MKEIRAIIRPNRLDRLRTALREVPGFPGLTVLRAEGFTAPSALAKRTDAEELTDFSPKLMVSVLAETDMVDRIEQVILEQCRTGHVGDGLLWTVEAGAVRRIRNGAALEDGATPDAPTPAPRHP